MDREDSGAPAAGPSGVARSPIIDAAALGAIGVTVREVDGRIVVRERESKGPHLVQFALPADRATGFAVSVRAMERPGIGLLLCRPDGSLQAAARARLEEPPRLEVTPGAEATIERDGADWLRLSLSAQAPLEAGTRGGIMVLAEDPGDIAYAGTKAAGLRLRDITVLGAPEDIGQPDPGPLWWAKAEARERILGSADRELRLTALDAATTEARHARLGIRLLRRGPQPWIELHPGDSDLAAFGGSSGTPAGTDGPVLAAPCQPDGAAAVATFAAALSPPDARLLAALLAALPRLAEQALADSKVAEPEAWRAAARAAAAFADAVPG